MQIKGLEDIQKLNLDQIRSIDPERIDLGTGLQDCILITQTFERGAHATPTEAAVFATVNRSLENTIVFSDAASKTLSGYLKIPQEAADESIKQAQDFISDQDTGGEDNGSSGGASAASDQVLQSLNIGNEKQATLGDSFGESLLGFAKDCIPCSLRLFAFLEMHPRADLLGALEFDVLARLKMLTDVGGLLNNFDIYGDFCELLNLLSFMCIPDLQRIIAMLMALLILEIPTFDGLIGVLQALIAPIFAPIFQAIIGLLDQFTALVTSPLDCIIDAVNQQLAKLGYQVSTDNPVDKFTNDLSNGLGELNKMILEGKQAIEDRLNFYIDQAKALLGELGGGDSAYLLLSLKKLKIIRMVGFIVAIISALTKGHSACSSKGKPPEQQELDSFFQNFLNPNSPFNLWVDEDGNINIDEKVPGFDQVATDPALGVRSTERTGVLGPQIGLNGAVLPSSTAGGRTLPTIGNILEFNGAPVVDITLAQTIEETSAILTRTGTVVVPCKLEVTAQDADKVNQFIGELSQL